MDAYEREEYKLNRKQQADKEYLVCVTFNTYGFSDSNSLSCSENLFIGNPSFLACILYRIQQKNYTFPEMALMAL